MIFSRNKQVIFDANDDKNLVTLDDCFCCDTNVLNSNQKESPWQVRPVDKCAGQAGDTGRKVGQETNPKPRFVQNLRKVYSDQFSINTLRKS